MLPGVLCYPVALDDEEPDALDEPDESLLKLGQWISDENVPELVGGSVLVGIRGCAGKPAGKRL